MPWASTKEIAKHFPALSPEQKRRVHLYCEHEMIETHQQIGQSHDPYFDHARFWRLALFDQNGTKTIFEYLIDKNQLSLRSSKGAALAWYTEVSTTKLYSALEYGESMSSMYVQINNLKFDEKIEAELRGVDILEDPLLRCLFSRDAASFQRSQLHRLLATPG
jgi:hypothetical protein